MAEGRFANKVVMITGAAGGFGAAAARRFAEEGAKLVLSDLDKRGLEAMASKLPTGSQVFRQGVDIKCEKQVMSHIEQSAEMLGDIDIAINNAGIGQSLAPLQATEEAEFDRVMAVNAKGVFLCMKHQLPRMIARRGGTILNLASAAGLVGSGHLAAYAASKHAVIGLTRSAADEVARYGIRVNALCPSFAPTELFNEMADEMAGKHGTDRQGAYDRVTARIPMRRVATVDEVVQAMLWACDPANSFMTGQAISIDGGLTAV
ncbi:3-oxoacyl-[acyl-carrier protein] reductase [Candidatus Rhodobacter oscarellae]|uniref:3-oxoacyl-[acyl-carrier protein] reductase n=2 Tax=Candidatus Rhodobacter oscarellae TaxID=1675527 RepID=A0A0J9E5V9_9RHOB|nr:3-oxoacyl-[acyl-carrier protein] reductase [Candidatus Rhodobacter lobularis]